MADIQKLVEELSKLTVMEAVELSKALEETLVRPPQLPKKNRNSMLFCPMLVQTNWLLSKPLKISQVWAWVKPKHWLNLRQRL